MMADRFVEEAEFWLPSDILMDNKENLNKNGQQLSSTNELCFPTEFPYDFEVEEDQLTELTRQLTLRQHIPSQQNFKKSWVVSGSPQSTLVQVGNWSGRSPGSSNGGSPNSPSQVSSPPLTPLGANNDALDLIYQAAGQVAKLKINDRDNRALLGPQHLNNSTSVLYNNYVQQLRKEQVVKQQQQRSGVWSNKQVKSDWIYELQQQQMMQNQGLRVGGLAKDEECGKPQAAWPSMQPYYQQQRNQQVGLGRKEVFFGGNVGVGVGGGGGGVKRKCAGTGVFLPRRYGSNNNNSSPPIWRKKPGCSTALLPAREVQALNNNFNHFNCGLVQSQCQLRFNGGQISDYDALMARSNALLMQQRRNLLLQGAMSCEISLPQEWTY